MRHIIVIYADDILGDAICYPEMQISTALTRADPKQLIYYRPYFLCETDDSYINMLQIATLLKDVEYDFTWATIDDDKKEAHTSIHRRDGRVWLNQTVTEYDLINSVWDKWMNRYQEMIRKEVKVL